MGVQAAVQERLFDLSAQEIELIERLARERCPMIGSGESEHRRIRNHGVNAFFARFLDVFEFY
jgi:hypothetical protein